MYDIRILFLVTGFPPDVSGVSLYNWERAQWLAKNTAYHIIVIAPDWGLAPEEWPFPEGKPDNLTIDRYHSKPWPPYSLTHVPRFSAFRWIEDRIEHYAPSIIVVTDVERLFLLGMWRLPGMTYAKMNSVPMIAEYHTDLYNFSAAYPGWQWLRAVIKRSRLTSHLYKGYLYTLCATHSAEQSCREMGIFNTRVTPYLGIDTSDFSPGLRDRSVLSSWLSSCELGNTVFLYLGRLGYEKRVDLLIRAFRLLRKKRDGISLLLVGDGPAEVMTYLRNEACNDSYIHFAGFQQGDHKSILMASCDVFCSPSPYETFGRTLVEAMASGLPIITVQSGAAAELIHSSQQGILVDSMDETSFATAMETFCPSGSSDLRHPSVVDVSTYSMESAGQALTGLYEQLLFPTAEDANLAS